MATNNNPHNLYIQGKELIDLINHAFSPKHGPTRRTSSEGLIAIGCISESFVYIRHDIYILLISIDYSGMSDQPNFALAL